VIKTRYYILFLYGYEIEIKGCRDKHETLMRCEPLMVLMGK